MQLVTCASYCIIRQLDVAAQTGHTSVNSWESRSSGAAKYYTFKIIYDSSTCNICHLVHLQFNISWKYMVAYLPSIRRRTIAALLVTTSKRTANLRRCWRRRNKNKHSTCASVKRTNLREYNISIARKRTVFIVFIDCFLIYCS